MSKARAAGAGARFAVRGVALGAVVGYIVGVLLGAWALAIGPMLGRATGGSPGALRDARARVIDLSAHTTAITLQPVHG